MIAATGFRAVDWLLIAVILVLLAISGLLALAETSLVRTSRVKAKSLLDEHRRAARAAEQSTADRVAALERYAAEVHGADAAYRDWRQHAAIAELTGPHLDLLARTAADDHGITELGALTQRARALRRSFTETQD